MDTRKLIVIKKEVCGHSLLIASTLSVTGKTGSSAKGEEDQERAVGGLRRDEKVLSRR